MVCMASFLSLNGRISSHFSNIRLRLPTHVYFIVLSHSIGSKYKRSKNSLHDVITNELYCYSTKLEKLEKLFYLNPVTSQS